MWDLQNELVGELVVFDRFGPVPCGLLDHEPVRLYDLTDETSQHNCLGCFVRGACGVVHGRFGAG